jgi:hypothetical protein
MKNIFYLLVLLGMVSFSHDSFSQNRAIKGKVVDSRDSTSLPGVTVKVKGTFVGTNTDANGNYSISVPGDSDILVFSFVGIKPQEVVVGSRSVINVSLSGRSEELDELVVVGYGSVKKKRSCPVNRYLA